MKNIKVILLLMISVIYSQSAYDVLRPFYGFDDSQTLTSSIGNATVASGNSIPGYTSNPANIGLYRFGLLQTNFVQNNFVSGNSEISNDNIGTLNWIHPFIVYKGSFAIGVSSNKERDYLSYAIENSEDRDDNTTEYVEGGQIKSKSFLFSIEFAQNVFLGAEIKRYTGENELRQTETISDSTFYFNPDYAGWGLVFGFLQRVNENINIGMSVELPTSLSVNDTYAEWDNNNVSGEYSDVWKYNVKRPMVFHAGTSIILNNLNLFYEIKFTDWDNLEFSSNNYYYGDIIDINNEVRDTFKSTTSHHLGMSYGFNKIPFNLYCGYQHLPVPYNDVYKSDIRNSYSLGMSYLLSNTVSFQSNYKLYKWTYGNQDETYSQLSFGISIHYK
jgi:hypothetical protein